MLCFGQVGSLTICKCVSHLLWTPAFDTLPVSIREVFIYPLSFLFLFNMCDLTIQPLGASVLVDRVSNVLTLILFVTSLEIQCSW